MDAHAVAALEERAALAESRLEALEDKLVGASPEVSSAEQGTDVATLSAQIAQLQQERDSARQAEAALRDENVKLKYRIDILKNSVREGDEKLKQALAGRA